MSELTNQTQILTNFGKPNVVNHDIPHTHLQTVKTNLRLVKHEFIFFLHTC